MIAPTFKKKFPCAAKLAERIGATVTYHGKAFWLDYCVQLTGFLTKQGKLLTIEDNEKIAIEKLKDHDEGMKELQQKTLWDRLEFILEQTRDLETKHGYTTTYRHKGGDAVTVFSDRRQVNVTLKTRADLMFQGRGESVEEAICDCRSSFRHFVGQERPEEKK